jgi:UDP-2,3-diacylglucosamine hydrolase
MSLDMINIQDGAIFISDAHDNAKRDGFYKFLQKIDSGEIKTIQLFLMGDMLDLLIGEISYLREKHKKYIELIDKIASKIELFYFEGNHDFLLKNLFENVKVIDISSQPLTCKINDKNILLSHGDKYGDFKHKLYTLFIRSKILLKFLNFIDKNCNSCVSKKILSDLQEKNICKKIKNFQDKIESKIPSYSLKDIDMIVEGHYHQDKVFEVNDVKYINFPSFACNQSYIIVQLSPEIKFKRGYDV